MPRGRRRRNVPEEFHFVGIFGSCFGEGAFHAIDHGGHGDVAVQRFAARTMHAARRRTDLFIGVGGNILLEEVEEAAIALEMPRSCRAPSERRTTGAGFSTTLRVRPNSVTISAGSSSPKRSAKKLRKAREIFDMLWVVFRIARQGKAKTGNKKPARPLRARRQG